MKPTRIYCEGITDQLFLADFIEFNYPISFIRETPKNKPIKISFKNDNSDIEIIDVGGCSKLKNDIWKNYLQQIVEKNGVNLIIFDADYENVDAGNNGFNSCKQKLEHLKNEYLFEFYIWPDNNSDGEIEDLLYSLIPEENKQIFSCMDKLQICLSNINIPNITIHKSETKEFINHYYFLTNNSSKLINRDYKNSILWNINVDENPKLKNLKQLLDIYIL